MLYKKNTQKTLSKDLFKNPSNEYRGAPFWAWNCDLNEGLLERQIKVLKEMGFGGFHMHSRCGMSMPYLGEEFMNRIKFCVDKAKENGMHAYLYDEDRWPSGAAGGLVTKERKFRNKYIRFYRNADAITNDVSREEATESGKPYFAVGYDIKLDENGYLESFKRIGKNDKAENMGWYGYVICSPDNQGWYNGQAYLDTMDEEAVQKFIETTHEAYFKNVGDEFDGVIPSIFTDEPSLFQISETLPKTPDTEEMFILPWTRFMQEKYTERYNADIFDDLPEVIWNLPNRKYSEKRYRFHDFISELFASGFSDQYGKWCMEHGIAFTGHVVEESELGIQSNSVGETMRQYRGFQIPGIDMLCNWQELTTAKQAQSVVHQYSREAMLSELYGVTNWTFDFKGHKYQGDWQAALGVTLRVPHLAWVSMEGKAKRDYPASISYQSPWYKEYSMIENHYARLASALSRGKPCVKVGVIHPVESYWLARGPLSQTANLRNSIEDKFHELTGWLLEGHYDFDFISESLLPSITKEDSKKIGSMDYDVILASDLITLRSTTLEFFRRFTAMGGKVIFIGSMPDLVDAKESSAVKEFFGEENIIPYKKSSINNALAPFATVRITSEGVEADGYIYNMREDGDDRWLFIANRYMPDDPSRKGFYKKYAFRPDKNHTDIEVEVKGEYFPVIYDTLSGNTYSVDYKYNGKTTKFSYRLYLSDSLLVKFCRNKEEYASEPRKADEVTVTSPILSRSGKVAYRRHEDNVLLLDIAELALDGGEYSAPEEILRGYVKISNDAFSLDMNELNKQPWVLPDEAPSHIVNVRYTIESEIDYATPTLALEKAEICDIFLNGEKVTAKPDGYYVDESIKKVALPPIKKGTNELVINVPISPRSYVEAAYLLGDFNVRLEGTVAVITEKTEKIGLSSVTSQGMPFYGGNIDYDFEIDLKETSNLMVHAYKFGGSLLKVSLDGKPAGRIAFEPYNVSIENVGAGKHTVTITCFGNRNNTFGALHWASGNRRWFSPDAWYKTGDDWSYEYNLSETGLLAGPVISTYKK